MLQSIATDLLNHANSKVSKDINTMTPEQVEQLKKVFKVIVATQKAAIEITDALGGNSEKVKEVYKVSTDVLNILNSEKPDLSYIQVLLIRLESLAESQQPTPNFPKGGIVNKN